MSSRLPSAVGMTDQRVYFMQRLVGVGPICCIHCTFALASLIETVLVGMSDDE